MADLDMWGHFDIADIDDIFGNVSTDGEELLNTDEDDLLVEALSQVETLLSQESTPDTEPGKKSATALNLKKSTSGTEKTVSSSSSKEGVSNSRYAVMSDHDIDHLVSSKESKGTKRVTNYGVRQLKLWLEARNNSSDFEMLPETELDDVLRRFYAEVRTTNGVLYSRSTYNGFRSSINRYIRSPPFTPFSRSISLLDTAFHKSNAVFAATLKKLSSEGLDETRHHNAISDGDLRQLRQSEEFLKVDPESLQRRVWFELTLAFGRRGRENVQTLKKNAFLFKKDDTGREYVQMAYNEHSKNHQGEKATLNREARPRMYAKLNHDKNCPVAALKLYLSKLNPENDRMFQQSKKKLNDQNEAWYTSRPVGEKKIGEFMPTLSAICGLSQRYTNHCVRATSITKLSHAGVSSRAIARITKHRDIKSLQHYESDSSDAQKRQYSNILNDEYEERDNANLHDKRWCPESRLSVTSEVQHPISPQRQSLSQNNFQSFIRQNPHFGNPFAMYHCNVSIHNHFQTQ